MDNVFVVIPVLNPEEKIMNKLIDDLQKSFKNILVVNDGSDKKHQAFFDKLAKKDIIVLKNYVNYGKGRALKNAFNYILNNYENVKAIVTADSDGQHSVKDIEKCALEALKEPETLVLGCRDIKASNVPKKSKYGNLITRNVFKIFIGLNITDTQTGLRAMSKKVLIKLLNVQGERYEYETKTLIECKEKDIPIKEVSIETIYLNNNVASHFNPFKDSISIYKLFFKYILSSLSSFIIDILLFSMFLKLFNSNINAAFIATIIARILSSTYNFLINAKLVFKKNTKNSIIKYFILVIIQMFISAILVNYFNLLMNRNVIFLKIIIDSIIFVVNFIIQREWVFKKAC